MEEKIYFKSDGLSLVGIVSKGEKETKKCVLLCHGITGNKDERGLYSDLAGLLLEKGFDSFRFDVRAHGESEGDSLKLTVDTWKRDIDHAIKFLEKYGYEEFGIISASFSGGPALLAASENASIKIIVLVNALIDYNSILDPKTKWAKYIVKAKLREMRKKGFIKIFGGFKVGIDLYNQIQEFNPWKTLENLKIPILFIHGDKDFVVPHEDSVKYSKVAEKGKMVTINKGDHGFSKESHRKQAAEEIIKFLENFK